MRLLFVRHGDPDYDHDCLTELGKKEAQLAAIRLAKRPIDAIYVSPLGRAKETAEATMAKNGMSGTTCEWLREFEAPIYRPDRNGELEIPWDWLPQDWTKQDVFFDTDAWSSHPLMEQTDVKKQYQWVCDGLDSILAKHGYVRDGRIYRVQKESEKTLCFFCHFGVTCVLLSHLLSISPILLWHGTVAAPASVSGVVSEERRQGIASFRMYSFGDTAHLEAAGLAENVNGRFTEVYSDFDHRHD